MQEEELKHTDIVREAEHCQKEQIPCCIIIPGLLKCSQRCRNRLFIQTHECSSALLPEEEDISKYRLMFQLGA